MTQEPGVGSIAKHFGKVRGPRFDRTKRHKLLDIPYRFGLGLVV